MSFFKGFLKMWTIFKVFIELVTLFLFSIFWPRGMWDLTPWPGILPAPPALGSKVLTVGPPEKSLFLTYLFTYYAFWIIKKNEMFIFKKGKPNLSVSPITIRWEQPLSSKWDSLQFGWVYSSGSMTFIMEHISCHMGVWYPGIRMSFNQQHKVQTWILDSHQGI